MVQGVLFSFRVHALACVFDREARRKRQSAFRVWTLNEDRKRQKT